MFASFESVDVGPQPAPSRPHEECIAGTHAGARRSFRSVQVDGGHLIAAWEHFDVVQAGNVEQDASTHEGWEGLYTQGGESLVACDLRGSYSAMEQPVVREVRQGIDMRTGVSPQDQDLACSGASVGPDHVTVAPEHCELEWWMVVRLGHPRSNLVREVVERKLMGT